MSKREAPGADTKVQFTHRSIAQQQDTWVSGGRNIYAKTVALSLPRYVADDGNGHCAMTNASVIKKKIRGNGNFKKWGNCEK